MLARRWCVVIVVALHVVLARRITTYGVGNDVRPVVVNDVMMFSTDDVPVPISDDVVMVIDVRAAIGWNDAMRTTVNDIVMLNSTDVPMRIADHMIVMVDVRLHESAMTMLIVSRADLDSELRRRRCRHCTDTRGK